MPEPDVSGLPTNIDGNTESYRGVHDDHHDLLHEWAQHIQALGLETALSTEASNRTAGDAATLAAAQTYADALSIALTPPTAAGVTGDGVASTFTISHTYDTELVEARVRLASGSSWSLVDCQPLSGSSVRVTIDNPVLTNGQTASVVVFPMGGLKGEQGDAGVVGDNALGGPTEILDAAGGTAAAALATVTSPANWSTAWVQNVGSNPGADEFYARLRLVGASFDWVQTDGPAGGLYVNALRPVSVAAGSSGAAMGYTGIDRPRVEIATATADVTVTYNASSAVGAQPVQVWLDHDGTDRALTLAGHDRTAGTIPATVTAPGIVIEFTDRGDGVIIATAAETSAA